MLTMTMARGFVMEFVSLDSIAAHSHALAVFVIYLFIRHYRLLQSGSPDLIRPSPSLVPTPKSNPKSNSNASVSCSNKREVDKDSSMVPTSSFFKTRHDYDDALSRLENDSSLEFESTFSERRRFLLACKGDVMATRQRLNHYLRWNNKHVKTRIEEKIKIKPTRDRDYDLWVESCLTAMKMNGEVENIVLPRIVRKLCRKIDKTKSRAAAIRNDNWSDDQKSEFRDREGHRVFCIRPALMDVKLAKASTYTLAVAIYLDRSFDRDQSEKVTVCVDVRAGRGWPNTHALRLIPFMKHSMKLLLPLFPERLHKALVYPVPAAFFYIWTIISKYMDPLTVERVRILEGKCKIEAPPPNEKLTVYLGDEELEQLEDSRINSFRA